MGEPSRRHRLPQVSPFLFLPLAYGAAAVTPAAAGTATLGNSNQTFHVTTVTWGHNNNNYLRKKGVGKGDEEMVGLKTVEVTPT